MEPKHLSLLAQTYAAHIGRGLYTVAGRVGVHSRFFTDLADGRGRAATCSVAALWFSENWPGDLEWPRHIPRPQKSKKEAA